MFYHKSEFDGFYWGRIFSSKKIIECLGTLGKKWTLFWCWYLKNSWVALFPLKSPFGGRWGYHRAILLTSTNFRQLTTGKFWASCVFWLVSHPLKTDYYCLNGKRVAAPMSMAKRGLLNFVVVAKHAWHGMFLVYNYGLYSRTNLKNVTVWGFTTVDRKGTISWNHRNIIGISGSDYVLLLE